MEFCRQEYWSGLSFPSPGDLPDPGIEPRQMLYHLSHQGSIYRLISISKIIPLPLTPLVCTFVLYVCDPISALQINSSVPFLDSTCKQYYAILKISSRPGPHSLMGMGPVYQTPSSSDHHRQFPFLSTGLPGLR